MLEVTDSAAGATSWHHHHDASPKLHEAHGVTGDAMLFRTELQADFEEPNAMNDLKSGWGAYLDLHVTDAAGSLNPGLQSLISRRARCASPTQSDDEKVRLSHWYILACR